MFEPHQFERDVLLKNQKENSMYTIKNAKIENITCDGNGAYLKQEPTSDIIVYWLKMVM